MIAEPYIKIAGKNAGSIEWFENSPLGDPLPTFWQSYADFEREKLRELGVWLFHTELDFGEGNDCAVFTLSVGFRTHDSEETIGYTSEWARKDTESSRLLKRAEFLKAVVEKEGLEWLPKQKKRTCGDLCLPHCNDSCLKKEIDPVKEMFDFQCLKCGERYFGTDETECDCQNKKEMCGEDGCRFISVCCERDPCKCGKEDYGQGGRCKQPEEKFYTKQEIDQREEQLLDIVECVQAQIDEHLNTVHRPFRTLVRKFHSCFL